MRWILAIAFLLFAVPAQAQQAAPQDPTGFTQALNAERAARRLPPLQYDPSLNGIARQNNAWQAARGQGHHVTGNLPQCSYVGPLSPLEALFGIRRPNLSGPGYIHSPGHAAILFSTQAVCIGLDQTGICNTVAVTFGR